MTVLTLASFTLREALRKKILLGALVLTVGFLIVYGAGMFFAVREFNNVSNGSPQIRALSLAGLLMAGLYVLNSIAGLLAIFVSVASISWEIDQGTLHAVIPRPVTRWQVIIGKWLGFAAMLVAYTAATTLATMAIVWAIGGYFPSGALGGVALMCLGTLLLLSLTMAGSTFLPAITNGIVIFMLYSVGTLGGMIEQIGWAITNRTMVNIGIISSLMIPTDSIWKMAAQALQTDLPGGRLAMAVMGPFASINPPSMWMAAYAGLYGLAAMAAAVIIFQRRDL